jgi:predicted transposase/invertase (TIGR01784 family)
LLRLSDSFINTDAAPNLELTVPVYNIAAGHNQDLLGQSMALSGYAMFVTLVEEERRSGGTLDEAIEKIIHRCGENGIMGAYLKKYSAEVRSMLITEWNDDEYREVLREEAREDGLEEGRKVGLEEGREERELEIARTMKADGDSIERIARLTGLSEEVIASL